MDYEKLKKRFEAKHKNKMLAYSFEDLGQPNKPLKINRTINKIRIDFGDRGVLNLRLYDLEKRPKTIYEVGLLFLYMTTGKRHNGFKMAIDEPKLKEMIENIEIAEVGTYKKTLVLEELK